MVFMPLLSDQCIANNEFKTSTHLTKGDQAQGNYIYCVIPLTN